MPCRQPHLRDSAGGNTYTHTDTDTDTDTIGLHTNNEWHYLLGRPCSDVHVEYVIHSGSAAPTKQYGELEWGGEGGNLLENSASTLRRGICIAKLHSRRVSLSSHRVLRSGFDPCCALVDASEKSSRTCLPNPTLRTALSFYHHGRPRPPLVQYAARTRRAARIGCASQGE